MKAAQFALVLVLLWLPPQAAAQTNTPVGTPLTGLTPEPTPAATPLSNELVWARSAPRTEERNVLTGTELGSQRGGASVGRTIGATVLILGLLFAVNYWLRKRGVGTKPAGRAARLRIVERVALDHRRSILLIEADGQGLVVAAGTERIETLAVLPDRSLTGEEHT
jgi:flagellar biogenesis protein FliO